MIKRYWYFTFIAIIALGCNPYLSHYKTAQEAFNRAAAGYNQSMAQPENFIANTAFESEYATARAFIMKAMGDSPSSSKTNHEKSKLAGDGLLLTAYNIRALSEWKLGMYSEALKTARACQNTFENDASVKNQRDYVVMEIMHALIYNDSILAYTNSLDKKKPISKASSTETNYLSLLETSMDIVDEQQKILASNNPLQIYMCISQLSIAKTWKDLFDALEQKMKKGGGVPADWSSEWGPKYDIIHKRALEVLTQLKEILPEESQHIYKEWKTIHGA